MANDEHLIHLGGTFRACLPDVTIKWLQPKVTKIGITRVANITGLDCVGIFVVTSIRPNAKHLSVSQGKGLTLELAKISAIMESFEGYHAENPPDTLMQGSYQELKIIQPVIHPNLFNQGTFTTKNLTTIELEWIRAKELFLILDNFLASKYQVDSQHDILRKIPL